MRDGEKWGAGIKAERLIDAQEGEEEWGMAGGGGDGGSQMGGGGRANFINEEMSDEQRQMARPLSA